MIRDANETESVWEELMTMPKEDLEALMLKNPATGQPDAIYTLLMQAVTEENIKYLCDRDGISVSTAKERLGALFLEANYPIPKQLFN